MSTRCQIKLKNPSEETKIYIYKHSDGYPSDVLPTLAPFVERFFKNRGNDEAYLLCQIVRAFAARDYQNAKADGDRFGKKPDENFNCSQDYLGWGLDTCKHGDIDFLYEIDEDGQIFVNGKLHKGAV